MGENCTSRCVTRDHSGFGECVRSQGQMIGYAASAKGMDLTAQKRWDKELDAYKAARKEGIQPAGTKRHQIENAKKISDLTGTAFKA